MESPDEVSVCKYLEKYYHHHHLLCAPALLRGSSYLTQFISMAYSMMIACIKSSPLDRNHPI